MELRRRDQLHRVGQRERQSKRLERCAAASGTFTVTPIAVGTYVYSMTCANSAGTSPTSSATLTVTTETDTGGGGKLDPATLLVLGGCVVLFRRRRARV